MHTRTVAGLMSMVAMLVAPAALASTVIFSGTGADAAGLTPVVDSFRAAIGGGAVAGANGSFGGVRREINWDGVPAAFAAPNNLPANFFNVNSPRGIVLSTPGTGFQVSGAPADSGAGQPAAANFGNINASYTTTFSPFSPPRLFTPLGSNVTDVTFFVPGTNAPALTRGFGAIFTDVDTSEAATLEFFDPLGVSLGTYAVPPASASAQLSFLGALFDSAVVSRVRIVAGNASLGAGVPDINGDPTDLVVMDDFIYAEPVGADLTIVKTHAGDFSQGASGAAYTITVANAGAAATSGTVTVTDTLPASVTPTTASGSGWTCGVVAQTVTCTRSDGLAGGAAYPSITITVSISPAAPTSVTNVATVTGGGDGNASNNTATDVASILLVLPAARPVPAIGGLGSLLGLAALVLLIGFGALRLRP